MKAVPRSVAGTNHLRKGRVGYGRKVRAAQDAPLVKMPAVGNGWIREKRMTAAPVVSNYSSGKGEKVV